MAVLSERMSSACAVARRHQEALRPRRESGVCDREGFHAAEGAEQGWLGQVSISVLWCFVGVFSVILGTHRVVSLFCPNPMALYLMTSIAFSLQTRGGKSSFKRGKFGFLWAPFGGAVLLLKTSAHFQKNPRA